MLIMRCCSAACIGAATATSHSHSKIGCELLLLTNSQLLKCSSSCCCVPSEVMKQARPWYFWRQNLLVQLYFKCISCHTSIHPWRISFQYWYKRLILAGFHKASRVLKHGWHSVFVQSKEPGQKFHCRGSLPTLITLLQWNGCGAICFC